jgi:hypothetical protein
LPLAHTATAKPRRRANHKEVSASSGAKVAAEPMKPISRPCASENIHTLPAMDANAKPRPRPTAPMSKGTITPKRSASRPIMMPPTPKPIISMV